MEQNVGTRKRSVNRKKWETGMYERFVLIPVSMVSLTAKTKIKSHPDFKTPKSKSHKLSKSASKSTSKSASDTNTKIISKRISMPTQSILVSTDELQDIFNRCTHFNAKKRIEAMIDLKKSLNKISNSTAHQFISIVANAITDDEVGVRKATKEIILQVLSIKNIIALTAYKELLTIAFRAGLTHVEPSIRTDTCVLISLINELDLVLERTGAVELIKILSERKSIDFMGVNVIMKILQVLSKRDESATQWRIKELRDLFDETKLVELDQQLLLKVREKINSLLETKVRMNKDVYKLKELLIEFGLEVEVEKKKVKREDEQAREKERRNKKGGSFAALMSEEEEDLEELVE